MDEINLEERIIKVAAEEFFKNGFEKTSMSKVASIVGIKRTTLHYYFRTKEKMFKAVFKNLMEDFLPKINFIFHEDILFMEKLEKIVDEYIKIFLEKPSFPQFILEEIQRDLGHLLEVMEELGFKNYLLEFRKIILKEMEEEKIKTYPVSFLFISFYSQLTFPFLTKSLLIELFYQDEKEYEIFLQDWKKHILEQNRLLLIN